MSDHPATETSVVIIGASAAGLATAACLKRQGVDYILLEQSQQVGTRWRGHYDRLHLHTIRSLSGLPHQPMPANYPRYPSRDQFVAYLEDYTAKQELAPRFGQQVIAVEQKGNGWITRTPNAEYKSRFVVVATGYARQPNLPTFPGVEQFRGTILHSREYKSGAPYKGQSVLVVGFGNSGGEIAVDLYEHGATPALSVRSAVNVIPRDILGIPVQAIGVYSPKTSLKMNDLLFTPLIRLTVGDIRKLGLRKLPYGPQTQMRKDHHIPLIDVGTIGHIRAGHITVYPGIKCFTETGVVFENDRELKVGAVVLATGYRPALHEFLPAAARVTDGQGNALNSGRESALPGLYLCGLQVSATGMLREIGIEAQRIAEAIKAKSAS